MGKVRFYSEDGGLYVVLRVEMDGLYLDSDKTRPHKKRGTMPPKSNGKLQPGETSSQFAARIHDEDLLEKILAVFDDFETTFGLDGKAMATFKPAYKKSGYDLSVKYRESWSSNSGQSLLETVLSYYLETIADD